ncbi:MAG: serine/threonine-protein kinase, partial [Pirellulales bacterium]
MKCPTRDALVEFALGNLADVEIASVADHLEACADCELTVSALESQSDTLIAQLRRPAEPSPHADEAEFEMAVAAVQEIGRQPTPADRAELERTLSNMSQLRDYRLLGKLGEGGMGTVYKALHTKLDRIVALKILPEHRSDKSSVSRFAREIAAVGKLNHPNIVRAHDAGEEDGMHYLVMELVDGIDLHRLVKKNGPLPIADACEIARQTALGLQHAHEHGLVHRDIKPSNLILASSPSAVRHATSAIVKILDLGLALRLTDAWRDENLTDTGQVMGTLDYMAPEQADDSHNVDIRADIYALGCTLFKLLSGRPPFGGDAHQTPVKKIMAHANDAPPSIRDFRSDVPQQLADLVRRLLAKDPADRPNSPADVARALQAFAASNNLERLAAQVEDEMQHDGRIASAEEIPVMLGAGGAGGTGGSVRHRRVDGDEPSWLRPSFYVWGGALLLGCACLFWTITIGGMIRTFHSGATGAVTADGLAGGIRDSLRYTVYSIPCFILGIIFLLKGYWWHRRA